MLLHVLCHEIVGNVETQWLCLLARNSLRKQMWINTCANSSCVRVYVYRRFNTAEQLFLPIISFLFDSRVNIHESSKRLYRLKIGETTIGYTIASVFDLGVKAIFVPLYFPVGPYICSINIHLHDGESGGNCVLKWRMTFRKILDNQHEPKKKSNQFYGANLFDCVTANYALAIKQSRWVILKCEGYKWFLCCATPRKKNYGMVWYLPAICFPPSSHFRIICKKLCVRW
jgi:hypothetical protein